MTDERDDLMKIFDTIINNDELWKSIDFYRTKEGTLNIRGVDKYGSKFNYLEKLI